MIEPVTPDTSRFDGFISYSRDDVVFARALERALEKFRPPKSLGLRSAPLEIFRDEGDLTGSEYFQSIDRYVQTSRKLILICSPSARHSSYVADEIKRFAATRGAEHVIPVILAGLANNEARPDQAEAMAFPETLVELLGTPLATDYRGFDPGRDKVDRGAFQNAWYTLLANLYGVGRNEIEQRDLRRKRKQRNLAVAIVAVVMVSLATLAAVAWVQKLRADEQRSIALQGLAANLADKAGALRERSPTESLLVGVEAVRTTRETTGRYIPAAEQALRDTLSVAGGQSLRGHTQELLALAFAPDGHHLLSLGRDGARLWPLEPGTAQPRVLGTVEPLASALSADGRWVALTEGEGVRIWDLARPQDEPVLFAGSGGEVNHLAVSDDGRWLVSADRAAALRLWERSRPQEPARLLVGHQPVELGRKMEGVSLLLFSPDQRTLLSAGWDNTVRLWDLTRPDATSSELPGYGGRVVLMAAFSPDGRWLVTAGWHERVRLWHREGDGWQLSDLLGEEVNVSQLRFSDDSRYLAVALDNEVRLWDLTGPDMPLSVLTGHEEPVKVLTFSSDQRWLVSAGQDANARLWDLGRLNRKPRLLPMGGGVAVAVFSPEGGTLALAGFDGARIWNLEEEDEPPLVLLGRARRIEHLVFDSSGQWLATASRDGEIRLLPLRNPHAGSLELRDARGEPSIRQEVRTDGSRSAAEGVLKGGLKNAAAFSPDGRWLAMAGIRGATLLVDLHQPGVPARKLIGAGPDVTAVAFSADSRWLATSGEDYAAELWELAHLEQVSLALPAVEGPQTGSTPAIALSPDSRWLAVAGGFGKVALWDRLHPEAGPTLIGDHRGWVLSAEFNGDGRWLVTAGADGTAQLWNASDFTAKPLSLAPGQGAIRARFSPDGKWLATAGQDASARLWTLASQPAEPRVLAGHRAGILDFSFSPDGRRFATASEDGHVFLWDLDDPAIPIVGDLEHPSLVEAVAFSPDSSRLATGSADQVARLWDLAKPAAAPILLHGHRTNIWWLGFSPDAGQLWLATLASDPTARLWPLPIERLMELACQTAGGNLPYDRWVETQGEKPYHKTCPQYPIDPSVVATGRDLARKGKVEQAIGLLTLARNLEPGLQLEPDREVRQLASGVLLETAKDLARDGKVEAARVQFERALKIDPALGFDPLRRAQDLARSEELRQAGQRLARSGAVTDAVTKFKEAMALDPELHIETEAEANRLAAPLVKEHAWRLAKAGEIEAAIERYRQVLEMDPAERFDPVQVAHAYAAGTEKVEGERLAQSGNVDEAIVRLRRALELDPSLKFDPVALAQKLAAPQIATEGVFMTHEGKVAQGVAAFAQARRFDPSLRIPATCWNLLCWHGCLWGEPGKVMAACQNAVEMEPENGGYRDSRGMARALTGDYPGAVADLQHYLQWAPENRNDPEALELRRQWVKVLKAGRNPITAEVLQRLREEKSRFLLVVPRCEERR